MVNDGQNLINVVEERPLTEGNYVLSSTYFSFDELKKQKGDYSSEPIKIGIQKLILTYLKVGNILEFNAKRKKKLLLYRLCTLKYGNARQ